MWQYNNQPIIHYGVKGMKWGVRRKQDERWDVIKKEAKESAAETKQFHEQKFTPIQ